MSHENSQQNRVDAAFPATGKRTTASVIPKHFKSDGEKKFDFMTYNVIGYMANVLLSIGAVYWVERTGGGQKFMDGLVNVAKKIPGVDEGWAKIVASKSFFLTGGFAVMLPMKWLEDKKAAWVKKENQKIYGDKVDSDPTLLQSQKEIEAAPKQTWSSLASSRLLSLVPFYITTALLWDRMSPLSKLTNPTLGALSKDAMKAMDASQLSHIASKGAYFDRPIAAASRALGKAAAWVMGDTKTLAQLETMQQRHPGIIKAPNLHGPTKGEHDPIHSALPYYFISEAITSAMVARGIYLISRVTAPFFDRQPPRDVADVSVVGKENAAQDGAAKAAPDAVNGAAKSSAALVMQPATRVEKQGLEHDAPVPELSTVRA